MEETNVAQFAYIKKLFLKASLVEMSISSRVIRTNLVLSTLLYLICCAKSDGMVTFRVGSKLALSQSCRSHIGIEIKRFSSRWFIDFSLEAAILRDS